MIQNGNDNNPHIDPLEVEEEIMDQDEEEHFDFLNDVNVNEEEESIDDDNEDDVEPDANAKDYATIKENAINKIRSMVGKKITLSTTNNGSMTWTVIKKWIHQILFWRKKINSLMVLKTFVPLITRKAKNSV
jgi:hypothetical protein